MTRFKYRWHVLRLALAGLVGMLLGLLTIVVRASYGAEVSFPVRVGSVPLELPFLFSFQISQHLWNDSVGDLYRHLLFSMLAYFSAGVLVYGAFQVVSHKVFYGVVCALAAVLVIGSASWMVLERPNDPLVDDFHVIQRDWSRMPIWVKGNTASGVVLLFLHGGPGHNSIEKHLCDSFRRLEEDYAIVYWDQRASGSSTGRPADAVVTVADRVDDLRQVVRFCQEQYRPKTLFLMGHSAGGELGTKYLIDAAGEERIAGWIEVDGSHNEPLGWDLSIAWLQNRAEQRIKTAKTEEERQFWKDAHNYAITRNQMENWYESELSNYLERAGGYDYEEVQEPPSLRGELRYLFSRTSFLTERINLMHSKQVFRDALATDYTPLMNRITAPTLLLWGEHDGAVPVELAWDAYHALGTATEHKRLVTFAKSAHNPMNEEPEKFYREVKRFVDRYALADSAHGAP